MKSRTLAPTPEQLRQQAQEMFRHAEQLEKTGATKDALKKSLVPATCAIMAGIIACMGKEGWGWFLFVAVLLAGSISIKG